MQHKPKRINVLLIGLSLLGLFYLPSFSWTSFRSDDTETESIHFIERFLKELISKPPKMDSIYHFYFYQAEAGKPDRSVEMKRYYKDTLFWEIKNCYANASFQVTELEKAKVMYPSDTLLKAYYPAQRGHIYYVRSFSKTCTASDLYVLYGFGKIISIIPINHPDGIIGWK